MEMHRQSVSAGDSNWAFLQRKCISEREGLLRGVCLEEKFWVFFLFVCLFVFCFLGPHLRHMEFPRLGVQLDLQLPAYVTATTTSDPSRVSTYIYHGSRQHRNLNPLSDARDRT